MSNSNSTLTAERLRHLFIYDELTGVFTRRIATGRGGYTNKAGEIAGTLRQHGYITMSVDGNDYYAHRLAWLYITGSWPDQTIDHINGIRSDNRFKNLRDIPIRKNCENKRVAGSGNTSGFLGVSKYRGKKWQAGIVVKGKRLRLGEYSTPELAYAAYVEAKRRLHGGCTI